MNDWSQPDFYRFNEDSLLLIQHIKHQHQGSVDSILDLGAGCGILGLELAQHFLPNTLCLLEAQEDFKEHLEKNCQQLSLTQTTTTFAFSTFGEWTSNEKYSMIVCNPPYYLKGHGEAAQDVRRNIARSFVVDDWTLLVTRLKRNLAKEGIAYIVLKNEPAIFKVVNEACAWTRITSQKKLLILELSGLDID